MKQVYDGKRVTVVLDESNPKDMRKIQKKTKGYQTMSKPELVKLVELLIQD